MPEGRKGGELCDLNIKHALTNGQNLIFSNNVADFKTCNRFFFLLKLEPFEFFFNE